MDALAALRLQIEWGADEALDDAPVNRLRPSQAEAPQPARPSPAIPAPPRAGPVARAQAAAAKANTLEALYRIVAGFTDCALATTATRMAWTDGDPASGLVILGEVPGPEEDLAGRPLVGPAGQLFGRMLASIGLTRADALLTNVVPWRPPRRPRAHRGGGRRLRPLHLASPHAAAPAADRDLGPDVSPPAHRPHRHHTPPARALA